MTAVPSVDGAQVLELAILITDDSLKELSRRSWVVSHPSELLASLPSWHQVAFAALSAGGNGLFDAILGPGARPLGEVASEALAFVTEWCPKGKCRLAGFSVHGDREVLRRELLLIYGHFSHQILDVSTVLSMATMWAPGKLFLRPRQEEAATTAAAAAAEPKSNEGAKTNGQHRAMADVEYSLETMLFLRKAFFENA